MKKIVAFLAVLLVAANIHASAITEIIAQNKSSNRSIHDTVVATYAQGFLLSNNTGIILVFLKENHPFTIGDQPTVRGTARTYACMLQSDESTVNKNDTAAAEPELEFGEHDMNDMLGTSIIQHELFTSKLGINSSHYHITVKKPSKALPVPFPNLFIFVDRRW